jgi:hypothetical protein
MKYVLGLSFNFKYYKNPANIKIFSNNQLIDDIDLTEDINSTNLSPVTLCKNLPEYNDWYYPWWNTWDAKHPLYSPQWEKIPEKMFVYTLDETNVQNSIKIEVTNDNTNYSNSFMTKWSSFTFQHIFLIPTYYLDLKNYYLLMQKKDSVIFSNPDNLTGLDKITNNLMWPDENRVVKNGQLIGINLDGTNDLWGVTTGGSFSFELPIIECILKKGLKMLGPVNYEQLLQKEKRRLYQSDLCPLYFNQFNLINTQNETA